jgi:hypothetical protein
MREAQPNRDDRLQQWQLGVRMSNLPAQGGGLPVEFENFTSGDEKTFPVPVSGKYSFDVKTASHVAVLPSSENSWTSGAAGLNRSVTLDAAER